MLFCGWSAACVTVCMSKFTPISLDRVDENDPTLAADGLSEFLPAGRSESDQMLAVSTLGDLFPARETDDIADFFNAFSAGSQASMNDEPAENDEPAKAPLEDDEADEAFVPGQAFRLDGFFESDDIIVSIGHSARGDRISALRGKIPRVRDRKPTAIATPQRRVRGRRARRSPQAPQAPQHPRPVSFPFPW